MIRFYSSWHGPRLRRGRLRPGQLGQHGASPGGPDNQAGLRQLVRQGIFVNLFKESGTERIGHGESASTDTFRNFIETFSIGVHRRSSAFIGG